MVEESSTLLLERFPLKLGKRLQLSWNESKLNKVITLILKSGVVILKAFYGYSSSVKNLYLEELKKWGYTRCFRTRRAAHRLLTDAISENALVVESDLNETVDIRFILQQMVLNSQLRFTLEDIETARGVYNPCLDDTVQPHLMLV